MSDLLDLAGGVEPDGRQDCLELVVGTTIDGSDRGEGPHHLRLGPAEHFVAHVVDGEVTMSGTDETRQRGPRGAGGVHGGRRETSEQFVDLLSTEGEVVRAQQDAGAGCHQAGQAHPGDPSTRQDEVPTCGHVAGKGGQQLGPRGSRELHRVEHQGDVATRRSRRLQRDVHGAGPDDRVGADRPSGCRRSRAGGHQMCGEGSGAVVAGYAAVDDITIAGADGTFGQSLVDEDGPPVSGRRLESDHRQVVPPPQRDEQALPEQHTAHLPTLALR